MEVCICTKPIATYTGVSDTNGGGYVDGYDADYSSFCNANGSAIDSLVGATTLTSSMTVNSTGVYSLYDISAPTGTICRVLITDVSASSTYLFYCYVTEDFGYKVDVAFMVVGPPSSGYDPMPTQSEIDAVITGLTTDDSWTIYAGGALATIEAAANLAKTEGYTVLVQTGTYIRTAEITGIEDIVVIGVDGNGDIAEGTDRPLEDLHTNAIQYGWRHNTSTDSFIKHISIQHLIYSLPGTITSVIKRDDDSNCYTYPVKVYVRNNGDAGTTWYNFGSYTDTTRDYGCASMVVTDLIGGFCYAATSRMSMRIYNSNIKAVVLFSGRYGSGNLGVFSSTIVTDAVSDIRAEMLVGNVTFVSITGDAPLIAVRYSSFGSTFSNCIFAGYGTGSGAPISDYPILINCGFYSTSSIAADILGDRWQNNIELSDDPFIDFVNGDYHLDPDEADFDKLYDTSTGHVLIGATGPELTTGGGEEITGFNVGFKA